MRREPEVPEAEVPEVECHDGFARITSKELASTHFVKSGTLQNACSTRTVEELYPTPHIHEQMTAYFMATTTSTLSQTR